MKNRILSLGICILMLFSITCFTACGSGSNESTEETLKAADPMTEEEMENDDSEGCIEDSDDLLY